MQTLKAKEAECAEEGKFSYAIQWTIPNWRQVREDLQLVKDQKAVFETGQELDQIVQTKWLVGFKGVSSGLNGMRARVYWQLLDIKAKGSGISVSQLKLEVNLCTHLCCASAIPLDEPVEKDEQNGEVGLGDIIEEKSEFLDIEITGTDGTDTNYINTDGSVQYALVLTFKTPVVDSIYSEQLKMEQFVKQSHDKYRQNMATLLYQDTKQDLKIFTSDGAELLAHKTILKVRCPVFEGMLNSNMSESKTGIVNVADISGKTMKVLLHYFYTGDLLNQWKDSDTIVEFTYSAGKYQMTQVLDILDALLGNNEVSNENLELLDMTGKLSLKNAEKRLLQRVVDKITKVQSSTELFHLLGLDCEKLSQNANILTNENVLEILDRALGNTSQEVDFSKQGLSLLALVQKNGLKNFEQVLLKRIAEIASKISSADDLFGLFGIGKENKYT